MILTVTRACNLRCAYCAVWDDPPPEMDTVSLLGLIDQVAAAGSERLSRGGGEPMLRDDVGQLVDGIAQLDHTDFGIHSACRSRQKGA